MCPHNYDPLEEAQYDHGTMLRIQLQELERGLAQHDYPLDRDQLTAEYAGVELDVGTGESLDDCLNHRFYESAGSVMEDINAYLADH